MTAPVVIVGAGVAGLATALAAAPRPVRLLSLGNGGSGAASTLAQGGLAAALGAGDSAEAHAADTLGAGAGHNDAARVRWLCGQAAGVVDWLQGHGVAFDRDASGGLHLGREGGHAAARIVHAGGDATGAALVRALSTTARSAAHIQWQEGVSATALLAGDGRIAGVAATRDGGIVEVIPAAAVVLATGGIGGLFARTSNPPEAQGSGLALALAAGARVHDLEFVQFHPTALDRTVGGGCASLPLVTEALRGAGACLVDGFGEPLMRGVHPLGDLAPRDVVARRIWEAQRGGAEVLLDARCIGAAWPRRFPTVFAACVDAGIDPRARPIPVTPAAHFHMGGIEVDADGRSSLPGLFAVGEVACTGVHGANRLASNSLLEGIAFGRRLGALLAASAMPRAASATTRYDLGPTLAPARLDELRQLLWHALGPVRSPAALRRALHLATGWVGEGWQARLAVALLAAALRRRERLGAHWRTDGREPALPQAAGT
ncbi:MAG: FAD-binding protein [Xanthomonadales bacterium]|nr:FAD-binding protein [Xanthomonadales bacterium]